MARICVVGLGLIGGSMVEALKGDHDLIGVDLNPAVVKAATAKGLKATKDLKEGLKGADLVIVAVPLGQVPRVLQQVAKLVEPQTWITDVGSVKGHIVKLAQGAFAPGHFVGGHPIAGSEARGLENAAPTMFQGVTYVLTPTTDEERQLAAQLKQWLAPLGAEFLEMDPADHDLALAYTSHMPFLMATAVARIAQGACNDVPDLTKVVAAAFRDTTRLAMSNPSLGKDICMANRTALLHAIAAMRYQLSQFEIMLQAEISTGLESLIEGVGNWRAELKP